MTEELRERARHMLDQMAEVVGWRFAPEELLDPAEQALRAVAREARREALEEAENARPRYTGRDRLGPKGVHFRVGFDDGTLEYRQAIRALADPPTPPA